MWCISISISWTKVLVMYEYIKWTIVHRCTICTYYVLVQLCIMVYICTKVYNIYQYIWYTQVYKGTKSVFDVYFMHRSIGSLSIHPMYDST